MKKIHLLTTTIAIGIISITFLQASEYGRRCKPSGDVVPNCVKAGSACGGTCTIVTYNPPCGNCDESYVSFCEISDAAPSESQTQTASCVMKTKSFWGIDYNSCECPTAQPAPVPGGGAASTCNCDL